MKPKNNLKRGIAKAVKRLAFKSAENDINSACVCFQYQPKLPKAFIKQKNKN